jgi:hypothetical protein
MRTPLTDRTTPKTSEVRSAPFGGVSSPPPLLTAKYTIRYFTGRVCSRIHRGGDQRFLFPPAASRMEVSAGLGEFPDFRRRVSAHGWRVAFFHDIASANLPQCKCSCGTQSRGSGTWGWLRLVCKISGITLGWLIFCLPYARPACKESSTVWQQLHILAADCHNLSFQEIETLAVKYGVVQCPSWQFAHDYPCSGILITGH